MVKIKVSYWLADKNNHPMVIEGTIKRETERAILFDSDHGETWYPKSQIEILTADPTVAKPTVVKSLTNDLIWEGNMDEDHEKYADFIVQFGGKTRVRVTVRVLEE